jgi:hypothetical protein
MSVANEQVDRAYNRARRLNQSLTKTELPVA